MFNLVQDICKYYIIEHRIHFTIDFYIFEIKLPILKKIACFNIAAYLIDFIPIKNINACNNNVCNTYQIEYKSKYL